MTRPPKASDTQKADDSASGGSSTGNATAQSRTVTTPPRPAVAPKAGVFQPRPLTGALRLHQDNDPKALTLPKAAAISSALHVFAPPTLIALLLLGLWVLSLLLHLNLLDWLQPKSKPQELVFSLVTDTGADRPEHPVLRGNFNQQAGGKHDPTQPLKPRQELETTQARKSETLQTTPEKEQPAPVRPPEPKTQPAASRPKPSIANAIEDEPIQDLSPRAADEEATPPDPLAGSPMGEVALGAGSANGSPVNGQEGNLAEPGVDVAEDADFGPFMADLERRIKRNWTPPRGQESLRVMLLFYLARDGKVLKIETSRTSGDNEADNAAIAAVYASAPFMPIPPQVKADVLPVEFTFDYNVLNSKKTGRDNRPVFKP